MLDRGMTPSSNAPAKLRVPPGGAANQISIEHYLRVILHRKWLVLGVFAAVSLTTVAVTRTLPDIYMSETTVLVDPQKVPEAYVKSTVTGDVRNRLGTIQQQILSATRLQKIIDSLNLYPEERKKMVREDLILKMRNDINVSVVSDFNSGQDVQAFRISYSGREPRLVAQVTNELAQLFIDENLKAREQQAEGTTDFLTNRLKEARDSLDQQDAKLRDFRMKHIGEMPEQETADLQILGQTQAQLNTVAEALARDDTERSTIQVMMHSQSAPVVDVDDSEPKTVSSQAPSAAAQAPAAQSILNRHKAELAEKLKHFGESHPEIRKLRAEIKDDEEKEAADQKAATPVAPVETKPPAAVVAQDGVPGAKQDPSSQPTRVAPPPAAYNNPVLQSRMKSIEEDIAKNRVEQQRLGRVLAAYQTKVEAIPVREQEIADLTRDYEISKAHYSQLLSNQMNAETASELEIRQKGEKFNVLDMAQPAEKPSRPKRVLMNSAGAAAGLILGIVLALVTEFLGLSITSADQIFAISGFHVLEVIPQIHTEADRLVRRRRMVLAAAGGLAAALAVGGGLLYHYRSQFF